VFTVDPSQKGAKSKTERMPSWKVMLKKKKNSINRTYNKKALRMKRDKNLCQNILLVEFDAKPEKSFSLT